MPEPTKFLLPEDAIPTHWVNLAGPTSPESRCRRSPRAPASPPAPDDLHARSSPWA